MSCWTSPCIQTTGHRDIQRLQCGLLAPHGVQGQCAKSRQGGDASDTNHLHSEQSLRSMAMAPKENTGTGIWISSEGCSSSWLSPEVRAPSLSLVFLWMLTCTTCLFCQAGVRQVLNKQTLRSSRSLKKSLSAERPYCLAAGMALGALSVRERQPAQHSVRRGYVSFEKLPLCPCSRPALGSDLPPALLPLPGRTSTRPLQKNSNYCDCQHLKVLPNRDEKGQKLRTLWHNS